MNFPVKKKLEEWKGKMQGFGSGFSDFVDPDPYWESGSMGKKIKKFQGKMHLLVI
jgi:hypothetical protein